MDPNRIIRLQQLGELTRELGIDGVVRAKLRFLVRESIGEVVKNRPQRTVAIAVLVTVEFRRLQINGRELDIASDQHLRLGSRLLNGLATPAKPDTPGILECCENPYCKASRGRAPSGQ